MRSSRHTFWIRQVLLATALLLIGLSSAPKLWAKGQFEVPIDCGDREQFEGSVRERMGSDARALLETLDLSIRRHPETYTLVMRVGAETRQLEDRNCADLFRAAVVVAVALWVAPAPALQPSAGLLPGSAPAAKATADPDKRMGSLDLPPLDSKVSPPHGRLLVLRGRSSPHRLRLSGELGLSGGLLPRVSPVFGLRGSMEFGTLGVAAGLRVLSPNEQRDGNGRGVGVMAVGGQFAGYFKPASGIGLEAGVSTYYLRGTGIGSVSTSSAALASFGPRLGVWAIPWQSEQFFLCLAAEGQLELLRPRFEIVDYGEVFRVSPLVWASFLAAGYAFR